MSHQFPRVGKAFKSWTRNKSDKARGRSFRKWEVRPRVEQLEVREVLAGTLSLSSGVLTLADTGTPTITVSLTGSNYTITDNNGFSSVPSGWNLSGAGNTTATDTNNDAGSITQIEFQTTNARLTSLVANAAALISINDTATATISGTNSFSGGLAVQGGTLQIGSAGAVPAGEPVTVDSGATLDLSGNNVSIASLNGAGTVENTGSSTTATLTVTAGGSFSGVIEDDAAEDSATAVQLNGGTLTLSGANSFTGGLTIQGGTFIAGVSDNPTHHTGAAGNDTTPIQLGTGATTSASLEAGTVTVANPINVGTAGALTVGNDGGSDDAYFSGSITLNGNGLTIGATGTSTSASVIASGDIMGTGNLVLNNSSAGGSIWIGFPPPSDVHAGPPQSPNDIDFTGTITNDGTGTGLTTISNIIDTNVTGVYENTTALAVSPLVLAGPNTFNSGVFIDGGTVDAAQLSQALGAGTVTLGNTTGAVPAALLISTSFLQFSNPIHLAANTSLSAVGDLTIGTTQAVTIGRPTDAQATFSGGVSGSNNLTINVAGNGNLNFNGSAISISGTITNDGTGLGTTIISSNLPSSVTGITENGSSNLILSGTNANTGTDTLTAGELSVAADANLGSTSGSPSSILFNGGTLQITSTALTTAASGMIGSHPYSITTNATVGLDINNPANTFTVSDALAQGTGGLTKLGAGTLVLTGANTYTGATLIDAGILQLGNGGTTGSLSTSSTIVDNSAYGPGANNNLTIPSTFVIDRSNTVTQGTDFSGAGIGTVSLAGSTTSGSTTISQLSSTALLADGMAVSGPGIPAGSTIATIVSATSIKLNNKATATATGVSLTFTETGGLANSGSGTTILTAANTYSGATSAYDGVLQVGNGGAGGSFGTGPVNVGSGNLIFDTSSTVTVPNVIQNLTGAPSGGSAPATTVANPGHDMVQMDPATGLESADTAINMHDEADVNGQDYAYHWGATGSDRPGQIPVIAPFNPIAVQAVGNTVGSGALFYLTTNESSQFTSATPTTIPVTYTAGSNTVTLTSGTIASNGIAIGEVVEGAGIVTVPADVNGNGGPGIGTSPTGTFITSVDTVHNTFTLNIAPTASGTSLLLPAMGNLQANGVGGVQIVSGGGNTSLGQVAYTAADVGKILTVAQGQGTFSIGSNSFVDGDGLTTATSLTPTQENYANPNVTPAQLEITQVTNGAITGVELVSGGTYQAYSPVMPGDQTYLIPIFTADVSGNTLTLDSYISGTDAPYAYGFNLAVGQTVTDTSTGTVLGTITALASGNGGIGSTYTLSQSVSSPISADSMTAQTQTTFTGSISANVLTVDSGSPSGSPLVVGDTFYAPNVPVGTAITAQLSGTAGGAGTYQLATLTGASLTVSDESMTAQLNQTLTTASGAQLPIESNMLSPALIQPTALDPSDQNGAPSGYGSALGHEVVTAYEMTSAHEYYAPLTGDTVAGTDTIMNVVDNSPAGTPYAVGFAVDGPGIPAGAIITGISGSTITLSQDALVTGTGESFDSWNEWTSAIDPNTIAAGGSGYTNGETVVALGGVTAAAGAPLLGTVTTSGGVVTGFTASDATNNGFQGDAADSANWYSVLPTVPCPVTGGSGSGALFNLTMNDPEITSGATGIGMATVVSGHGGTGYVVGDVLTLSAPAGVTPQGTAATLTVTAVNGSGSILAVNVKTAGSYSAYNPATLFYIAPLPGGSSGSGAILSWQALQTSVPDNASSALSPDAGVASGGGYSVGDVLVVSSPSSWTDSNGHSATWITAPILQVTNYTYSAIGGTFTYNLINTPVSSTGAFPLSSDTFNLFPLGYTPSTTVIGPNNYYGAGVNGGVAEFAAGATVNFGPQVFGGAPGSVMQEGTGTTILTAQNTYTGATSVANGTLQVDGSIAASSGVTVSSGATLSGLGTVSSTTVNGTLEPGDPGVAGTLNTDLSFGAGSTLQINENTVSSSVVVGEVSVTGTASLSNCSLSVAFADNTPVGTTYTIVHTTGGLGGTTFKSLPDGSTVSDARGHVFQVHYTATDVTLTAELALNSKLIDANTAPIGSLAVAGNVITVTTLGNTTFTAGSAVLIVGSSVAADNGSYVIQTGSSNSGTFTYVDNNSGIANATGGTATAAGGSGSLGTGVVGSSQRSMVDSITYTFSEPVPAPSVSITVHSGQTGTVPTLTVSSIDGNSMSRIWVVTFSGASVIGNSIADGVYDVSMTDGTINQSDTFYRLFGDINGDGRVNNTDFGFFNSSFGLRSTNSGYIAAFDFNADGRVNNTDFGFFNANFGKRFSGFTSTL